MSSHLDRFTFGTVSEEIRKIQIHLHQNLIEKANNSAKKRCDEKYKKTTENSRNVTELGTVQKERKSCGSRRILINACLDAKNQLYIVENEPL